MLMYKIISNCDEKRKSVFVLYGPKRFEFTVLIEAAVRMRQELHYAGPIIGNIVL